MRNFIDTVQKVGGLVRRFRSERRGSVAVEAALVLTIFSLGASQLITVKTISDTNSNLADSLHASAQYVVHGGTDLERLRALFVQNYGSAPIAFTTGIVCSMEPVLLEDGSLDTESDAFTQYKDYGTEPKGNAKQQDGSWTACGNQRPLRFLDIHVIDDAPGLFGQDRTSVDARLRIRV